MLFKDRGVRTTGLGCRTIRSRCKPYDSVGDSEIVVIEGHDRRQSINKEVRKEKRDVHEQGKVRSEGRAGKVKAGLIV